MCEAGTVRYSSLKPPCAVAGMVLQNVVGYRVAVGIQDDAIDQAVGLLDCRAVGTGRIAASNSRTV